jgi:hypothetical protein
VNAAQNLHIDGVEPLLSAATKLMCDCLHFKVKVKVKLSLSEVMDTDEGHNVGLPSYFDTRHNYDARVVSSTRRSHFWTKVIPWYTFLLEAEWTPE